MNLTVIYATDKKEITLNEMSENIVEKVQGKKLPGFEPGKGVRTKECGCVGPGSLAWDKNSQNSKASK